MSGVLRRGSLNFDCNLNGKRARGSYDSNLYGGYRDAKPRTPEISVIALDFRRYSEDLKKDGGGAGKSPAEPNAATLPPAGGAARASRQDDDSDEISDLIGHYGKWQFVWTLLLCLFQLPSTFQLFAFIFQTAEKKYWCARPAYLADTVDLATWRNLTQSQTDACHLLNIDYGSAVASAPYDNYTTCTEFEFEHTPGDGDAQTLIEEFSLVCDRRQLLTVVEMCFLAGVAVGSVSSGWISDRFGRKHTLMAFALIQTVFGTLLAFVNSMAMLMTLRVVLGFASMTVTVVSFVLVVELVSGRWRTIIGILNILPVALTYVLTAGIAYLVRDWRMLQLAISLPELLLLLIWYCVPESPRWLLARGRLPELYALVERAARMNRLSLPSNYQKSLEAAAPRPPRTAASDLEASNGADSAPADGDTRVDCNASPLVVVFSEAYWRTTCLTLVVWLTLIIIYFGLTLHLSNLGGNIYVNTAIAGSVEAVSICASVFVVLRLGIRRNLIAYMLISGVCCLATNLVPHSNDSHQVGVIALAMIAKCVIGANNAIIPTFTAMQYPTVVRNFGVGMGNLAAGVGLILVPYLWMLERVEPLLPMSIMGVAGLVGAAALLLMKNAQQ